MQANGSASNPNKKVKKVSSLGERYQLSELYQFALAGLVISAFIVFYYMDLSRNLATTSLETIGSTFGNIVAVIIGYYFGQRPVHQLTREIETVASEKQSTKDEFFQTYDIAQSNESEIDLLREKVMKLNEENNLLQQMVDKLTKGTNLK